jgi:annexin A7/11
MIMFYAAKDPHELIMLREAYKKEYNRSMDQDVLDDLSLKTKDAFTMVLNGQWHDNGCVDINFVQRDVQDLIPAFRLGFTNEMLM